jgi:hypothetical protein
MNEGLATLNVKHEKFNRIQVEILMGFRHQLYHSAVKSFFYDDNPQVFKKLLDIFGEEFVMYRVNLLQSGGGLVREEVFTSTGALRDFLNLLSVDSENINYIINNIKK